MKILTPIHIFGERQLSRKLIMLRNLQEKFQLLKSSGMKMQK